MGANMSPMPEFVIGDAVDHAGHYRDRGRVWWIPQDHGPIIRINIRDWVLGRQSWVAVEAIGDFPLDAARGMRTQLDAAIGEAEASLQTYRYQPASAASEETSSV